MGEDVAGVAGVADGPDAPRVALTSPQWPRWVARWPVRWRRRSTPRPPTSRPRARGRHFCGPNAPGTTRFVIETDRDTIVDPTFVGPEVAELLHAATIAVTLELPLPALAHAIPPFPTRSELWPKLIEAVGL